MRNPKNVVSGTVANGRSIKWVPFDSKILIVNDLLYMIMGADNSEV